MKPINWRDVAVLRAMASAFQNIADEVGDAFHQTMWEKRAQGANRAADALAAMCGTDPTDVMEQLAKAEAENDRLRIALAGTVAMMGWLHRDSVRHGHWPGGFSPDGAYFTAVEALTENKYDVVFRRRFDSPDDVQVIATDLTREEAARARCVSGDLVVYAGTNLCAQGSWWLWLWERNDETAYSRRAQYFDTLMLR